MKNLKIITTLVFFAIVIIALYAYFSNQNNATTSEPDGLPSQLDSVEVNLYYYNVLNDTDDSGNVLCSADSVVPVKRALVTETKDPLLLAEATINLLIQGSLTEQELNEGISTEFPNEQFELLDITEDQNVVTLTFTEVPGFTSGGSCRTALLRAQIEETVPQFFDEDTEIVLAPEEIFQP